MSFLQLCSCLMSVLFFTVSCYGENNNLPIKVLPESFNANEQFLSNRRNPWDPHVGKFECPSTFGTFPDPDDCDYFYSCFGKWGTRRKCPRFQQFDKYKKRCLSFLIAVCDDATKTTIEQLTTEVTHQKETFRCPYMLGTFAHPEDCSLYYTCSFFRPSLGTCPQSQLFDSVEKQCRPANEVHCGTRIRPTDATIADSTSTDSVTTPEATREVTTPETTREVTTAETATTSKPHVTAPDTHCDEDDLDCIIDDLGEKPDWFECPKDMGSYPHPTSKKLFIFCLNWRPRVKKCGQGLIFSEDAMTCIQPR